MYDSKQITQRLLIGLTVFSFLLFVPAPAPAANEFFKAIKDKLLKPFASCYKASQRAKGQCDQNRDQRWERIENTIDSLNGEYASQGNEEVKRTIAKQIEGLNRDLGTILTNWDSCVERADHDLIDCRLDKGHFKRGCDESKMDREFKELADKEDDIREMYKKCYADCEDDLERARRKAGDDIEKLTEAVQDHAGEWDKCTKGLKKDLNRYRDHAEKERYKILEQCISTERSSR